VKRVYRFMKSTLPPQLSHRMRVVKSLVVDRELANLRTLAKQVGGRHLVAIDVGANDGLYSFVLSRYFGNVIVIEPNPICVQYLRNVLPRNCLIVDVAVSNVQGVADLTIPRLDGVSAATRGTISTSNPISMNADSTCGISVATQTLDELIKDQRSKVFGRIALLKVDVEGHEFEVFQGATDLLKVEQPIIFSEIEERHGAPLKNIIAFLTDRGYTISNPNDKTPQINYVFVPQ